MDAWRIFTPQSVPEIYAALRDATPQHDREVNRWVFRGQADVCWPLRPSLARIVAGLGAEAIAGRERLALERFAREAHLVLDATTLPPRDNDPTKWWSLMQHYGAATRLLDWSYSPYVALYYACTERPDADGAIWIVDVGAVADRTRERHAHILRPDGSMLFPWFSTDGDGSVIHFQEPWRQTDRMAVQQGLHSFATDPTADHDAILASLFGERPQRWTSKVIVPSKLKRPCTAHLRKLNVSGRGLLPGADGLGARAKELVQSAQADELAVLGVPGAERWWDP